VFTFTLTTGADAGPDFTGGAEDDVFVGTDTTLTAGDDLDGADGDDQLNYSASLDGDTFHGYMV